MRFREEALASNNYRLRHRPDELNQIARSVDHVCSARNRCEAFYDTRSKVYQSHSRALLLNTWLIRYINCVFGHYICDLKGVLSHARSVVRIIASGRAPTDRFLWIAAGGLMSGPIVFHGWRPVGYYLDNQGNFLTKLGDT